MKKYKACILCSLKEKCGLFVVSGGGVEKCQTKDSYMERTASCTVSATGSDGDQGR